MSDQLQAMLHSIYSAPQPTSIPPPPPKSQKRQMPRSSATDLDLFASDDFRMYCYKIVPCSIRGPHEWTTCGFCHPGEKAMRRCPEKFQYLAIACPDVKAGECPRGEACPYAHTVFEYWLHPSRYRTQMCSYGAECKRPICFFAHQFNELRDTAHLPQLQAIEREMEGDNGFGLSGGSRWASLPNTKPQGSPGQLQQQRSLEPSHSRNFGQVMQCSQLKSQTSGLNPNQQPFIPGLGSMPSVGAPMPPRLSTTTSLQAPLHSMTSHDIDNQMAAAMKLLADLSQQPAFPPPNACTSHLRTQQSTPAPYAEQSMCAAGSLPNTLPSGDLQAAIMNMLPELLRKMGAALPPPPPPPQHHAPMPPLSPYFSSASSVPLSSAALAGLSTPLRGSDMLTLEHKSLSTYSPNDVLSIRSVSASVKSIGSASPRSSEGCRSPAPSSRGGDCESEGSRIGLGFAGTGMGLGMELGLGLMTEDPVVDMREDGINNDSLYNHSFLIESLSQLVDEPSPANMHSGSKELQKELSSWNTSSVTTSAKRIAS
eukprot:gene22321-29396_t